MMIEYYKKPSVKFVVNKKIFNKLIGILTFQEKNMTIESWREKAGELKELLFDYVAPQKDENGEIAIIDISLFQHEAAELIILLIDAFKDLEESEDYTKLIKKNLKDLEEKA